MDRRQDIHNSDIPIPCRACEARHGGICGALTAEELLELSKHTIKHALKPEQEVSTSRSSSQRYSNILKGVVKLSKATSDGRLQIVGLQFAPDFLGRPFGEQDELSAEAVTEVGVCTFPKSVLNQLMDKSPGLERRLYKQSLRELEEARSWMLTLGRKNAQERVVSFLCLLATHADPELQDDSNKAAFEIPLKRSDIADFLGLTIETVSRQITKLRHAGLITLTDNRFVEIPDLAKLQDLAESGT